MKTSVSSNHPQSFNFWWNKPKLISFPFFPPFYTIPLITDFCKLEWFSRIELWGKRLCSNIWQNINGKINIKKISLKKLVRERLSLLNFSKAYRYIMLQTTFYNLLDFPLWRRQIKFTPVPIKKCGIQNIPADREINTNFPQQKPIVTRPHGPLREKKKYEKYEYLIKTYSLHIKSICRHFLLLLGRR